MTAMVTRTFAALAAALLLTACADTRGRPVATRGMEEPEPEPAAASAGSVLVTNHNRSLVIVRALIDGNNVRLGQVETGQSLTLTLPAGAHGATEVELVADPLASDEIYRTGPLLFAPGARIVLVVENQLALSHARVEAP
jgi:hypothetical protein